MRRRKTRQRNKRLAERRRGHRQPDASRILIHRTEPPRRRPSHQGGLGRVRVGHCVGVDLKTVQVQLGHSSIVLTAGTYTSVLTDLLAYAAEVTAKRVLAAAARNPGHRHRRNDHPAKSAAAAGMASIKRR
jgi:integrase